MKSKKPKKPAANVVLNIGDQFIAVGGNFGQRESEPKTREEYLGSIIHTAIALGCAGDRKTNLTISQVTQRVLTEAKLLDDADIVLFEMFINKVFFGINNCDATAEYV